MAKRKYEKHGFVQGRLFDDVAVPSNGTYRYQCCVCGKPKIIASAICACGNSYSTALPKEFKSAFEWLHSEDNERLSE